MQDLECRRQRGSVLYEVEDTAPDFEGSSDVSSEKFSVTPPLILSPYPLGILGIS
jgi:hypothetical protein